MNKQELLDLFSTTLEDREITFDEMEEQPGLKWFVPLSENYQEDYSLGEIFFTSDLSDQPMEDLEIAQMNMVFQRGLPQGSEDALRAYFSRVNRLISGGRFDVQLDGDVFVEYGHDLVIGTDETNEQALRKLELALDLGLAYISFVYPVLRGLASGEMTVEQALDITYNQE